MKKSLQRQTLPVIPAQPRPLGIWNSILLLMFGISLGCAWGITTKAKATQTVYESLTEKDRSDLNGLIANLTNKGETL